MQVGKSRVLALLAVLSIVGRGLRHVRDAEPGSSDERRVDPGRPPPRPQRRPRRRAPTGLPPTDTTVYPRAQTLYTSGKQWGAPSTWNPFDPQLRDGRRGPPVRDPLPVRPDQGRLHPVARHEAASWDSTKTTYTINVRQGVTWSDGSALTAADVAFSINLYQNTTLGSDLFTFVNTTSTASGNNVVVTFKGTRHTRNGMQCALQHADRPGGDLDAVQQRRTSSSS